MRSSTDETAAGKVFVAFLAVILLKELENRLRVSGQLKNTSVNNAFDLVRKFIKMRFTDGKELTLEVPLKSRIVFEGVAPGLLMENGVEPGEATRSALAGGTIVVISCHEKFRLLMAVNLCPE